MKQGHRIRGFTLVELIGVIAVIAILLAISVPAFSSLIVSSAVSRADSQVKLAAREARDVALRSFGGDVVVAFFYEPRGRVTAAIYRQVPGALTIDSVTLEVFAPDGALTPRQLPQGLVVRGLALPSSDVLDTTADSGDAFDGQPAWYSTERYLDGRANWVLPETGFYDRELGTEGRKRQTFVMRFEAGTGRVVLNNRPIMLVDPSPSQEFRTGALLTAFDPTRRVDLLTWAAQILTEQPQADQEQLLGDVATDTVLAFPVAQIAVYRPEEVARQLRNAGVPGSEVSSALEESGDFYRYDEAGGFAISQAGEVIEALMGERADARGGGRPNPSLARAGEVYSINRTTGELTALDIEEESP